MVEWREEFGKALEPEQISRCLEFAIPVYSVMYRPRVKVRKELGMRLNNQYYDDFRWAESRAVTAKHLWIHVDEVLPVMLELDEQGLCARYLNTAVHYPMIPTQNWWGFWYNHWTFKKYGIHVEEQRRWTAYADFKNKQCSH